MTLANRQTVSYLQRKFREVGLHPDSRHGQNFLIDLNLLSLLVRAAELDKHDFVLEIGTGTGSLTAQLADLAGAVLTVEIDARLHQLAAEELRARANVELLQQDALRNKNNIHPIVLQKIDEKLQAPGISRFKLVANLPYNVATPLISNLLTTPHVPQRMAVTIQKELADRMVAAPGSKDYSALSVWIQTLCTAEILRTLPATAFWPRPKVQSAFVLIVPQPKLRERVANVEAYHQFVRSLFFHRRKFLRSNLVSALKGQFDKAEVDQLMGSQGLSENSRAEELTITQFVDLFHAVYLNRQEST